MRVLTYDQLGVGYSVRVIDGDPFTTGLTYQLGMVTNARSVTRDDRTWIGYIPQGASEVQLATIGSNGLVPGPAPQLRVPFDLLVSGAFWINGLELHTGDTCLK